MSLLLTKSFQKKIDKSIKIAAEGDWMSKISQNIRKLGFSWKKQVGFPKRKCFILKN